MITLSRSHLIIYFIIAGIIGGGITFTIIKSQKSENEFTMLETFNKEPGEISRTKAQAMVKAYQEGMRTSKPDIPLVNSVYFDFGSLAKYMIKMIGIAKATGVRIYFGRYDTTEPRNVESDVPGQTEELDLKGYNSVVLVATKKIGKNIVDILRGPDKKLLNILYQPYNGGISCPPYPEWVCKGQSLLALAKDSSFVPIQ